MVRTMDVLLLKEVVDDTVVMKKAGVTVFVTVEDVDVMVTVAVVGILHSYAVHKAARGIVLKSVRRLLVILRYIDFLVEVKI